MKTISNLILVVLSYYLPAQIQKEHTLTMMVDGKEMKAVPQNLKFGSYRYITASTSKPDQNLRIWIGSWDGGVIYEPGKYLIVNADKPDTKDNFKKAQDLGTFKGIAAIKYIIETKSPRMEFHMGETQNNNEYIEIAKSDDGFYEFKFNTSMNGTWWKEKSSATLFGGLDRIVDKMKDKAVTNATGFDQDIDPEGRGYKKQKNTDKIEIKDAIVRLKLSTEK